MILVKKLRKMERVSSLVRILIEKGSPNGGLMCFIQYCSTCEDAFNGVSKCPGYGY